MSAVGWAYWLNDHWHLCADEPTAHERRQRVYLAEDLDALKAERDSIHEIAAAVIRERDALRAELDAAHDARIEAQNPGIDIEDVRRHRREARARAALDSDPDLAERTRRIRADE